MRKCASCLVSEEEQDFKELQGEQLCRPCFIMIRKDEEQ